MSRVSVDWGPVGAVALAEHCSVVLQASADTCRSGIELVEAGYPDDVAMAEMIDADGVVPLLIDGTLVDAS